MTTLIGPFTQALPLNNLPETGSISDELLQVATDFAVVSDEYGKIKEVGNFSSLIKKAEDAKWKIDRVEQRMTLLPGMIDAHTHLCWGGNRARDYALRISGKSYLEIARQGGGILDTVKKTRAASKEELIDSMCGRAVKLLSNGITTVEVKSGYGLNTIEELKLLEAINEAADRLKIDIIATCLAAHMKPHDFNGTNLDYLNHCLKDLLPKVKEKKLSQRVDIFIEESAFNLEEGRHYLSEAKSQGFALTVHADQFTAGASSLAVELGAKSADHLEASTKKEIEILAKSKTVAVALPGASLGLGYDLTPARELLNLGACVAIASDWNPGSAPMGDLLTQAAIFGAYQKLSTAETFAGITIRAAKALGVEKICGSIEAGKLCDLVAFPCDDYQQILYHQGQLKPTKVWKRGELCHG